MGETEMTTDAAPGQPGTAPSPIRREAAVFGFIEGMDGPGIEALSSVFFVLGGA